MAAKPGNKNALKHGFYAKHFITKEKTKLRKQESTDLESEINALRIVVDRILGRLNTGDLDVELEGKLTDQTIKTLHVLIDASTAIGTLSRSQQLITGKYMPVEEAVFDALAKMNDEDGI